MQPVATHHLRLPADRGRIVGMGNEVVPLIDQRSQRDGRHHAEGERPVAAPDKEQGTEDRVGREHHPHRQKDQRKVRGVHVVLPVAPSKVGVERQPQDATRPDVQKPAMGRPLAEGPGHKDAGHEQQLHHRDRARTQPNCDAARNCQHDATGRWRPEEEPQHPAERVRRRPAPARRRLRPRIGRLRILPRHRCRLLLHAATLPRPITLCTRRARPRTAALRHRFRLPARPLRR